MERVVIFDIPFCSISLAEMSAAILDRVRSKTPGFVVTPNVDHVCRFHRDDRFRACYAHAFLIVPDGVPLLWSARALGKPLREKLSGSDLVPELCAFAAKEGLSVFFFGGRPGSAEQAAAHLSREHPGLRVAGTYCPPMNFEQSPDSNNDAIAVLEQARPDLCFVAMGSPRQELWIHAHYQQCGAIVMLGIGAGLDFASGIVRRAPRLLQRIGLEWLWRLAWEPRRLWRRYLVDDLYFFVILAREFRGRRPDNPSARAD